MLHRPDPSVRAALIPDVDHVVAGHEVPDLETAFGVDRHRPLPEAGRGATHAHCGDAEPRDAVAARVHHLAPHAHEPGRGQREVDVVEVEPGLDAQRLALFLHAHAGVEGGHVDGGIGPFGRGQRLADVGAHVVVARRGRDAIDPVLGGLCERGRGPPAAEQGTAHGIEHDFHALQPVAAIVEDAAVDGAGGGEADVDAGRHAAGTDVDRGAERRVERAVPAPHVALGARHHGVGAGLDRPGFEPPVVVGRAGGRVLGPGDFVAGTGDGTPGLRVDDLPADNARSRRNRLARRREPGSAPRPGEAAVPVSVALAITARTSASGAAAATHPDGRGGRGRRRQQSAHPLEERAVGGRQGQRGAAPQRLEIGQSGRVDQAIAAERDGDVVAAVLTLGADTARDPPAGRVVEEQDLGGRLQDVDGEVVAADVGELVRDDGVEMRGRETRQGAGGQQDTGRSHPTTDGTWTRADCTTRTGRATARRCASSRVRAITASATGMSARRRTRSTHSQASARRSDRPETPTQPHRHESHRPALEAVAPRRGTGLEHRRAKSGESPVRNRRARPDRARARRRRRGQRRGPRGQAAPRSARQWPSTRPPSAQARCRRPGSGSTAGCRRAHATRGR